MDFVRSSPRRRIYFTDSHFGEVIFHWYSLEAPWTNRLAWISIPFELSSQDPTLVILPTSISSWTFVQFDRDDYLGHCRQRLISTNHDRLRSLDVDCLFASIFTFILNDLPTIAPPSNSEISPIPFRLAQTVLINGKSRLFDWFPPKISIQTRSDVALFLSRIKYRVLKGS